MCGTFSQNKDGKVIRDAWIKQDSDRTRNAKISIQGAEQLESEILFPGMHAFTLLEWQGDYHLHQKRWGIIPKWWSVEKADKPGKPLYLARAESVHEKPSFRDSFTHHRCLVMADKYWEFSRKHGELEKIEATKKDAFWLGGIFSIWKNPENPSDRRHSFSLLTVSSEKDSELWEYHDRKPLELQTPEEQLLWLNRETPQKTLEELMRPRLTDGLQLEVVSNR